MYSNGSTPNLSINSVAFPVKRLWWTAIRKELSAAVAKALGIVPVSSLVFTSSTLP